MTDHYAIIPTGDTAEIASLSKLQADVYDLIVRRFLSIFYPTATYKTVNISFMVDNELFTTSSKCLVDKGYLDIINISDDEDDDSSKTDNKLLPFANSVKSVMPLRLMAMTPRRERHHHLIDIIQVH